MIRPKKLGHIVLKVQDIHKSVDFYTNVVGLEVSDWIADQMVFLRCAQDHHDLALFQLPPDAKHFNDLSKEDGPGLEHFSYEIESFAVMEDAVRMLKAKGIPIVRGPGKHGPGENCFLVFKDPDGNFVEFYCEMRQITKDAPYKANVWPDDLDAFDRWHFEKFAVAPPKAYQERAKPPGAKVKADRDE
jgi:catechol-2,3-dioxygenase